MELLLLACEATDTAETLNQIVAREGPTIRTTTGQRAHPLLKEILANRGFIARTLTKLGVTVDTARPIGRPSPGFGWRPDGA
jgi:hypothetical protein